MPSLSGNTKMTTEKYTQDLSDKYDVDASAYVFLHQGSAYTHSQAHMPEKYTLDYIGRHMNIS